MTKVLPIYYASMLKDATYGAYQMLSEGDPSDEGGPSITEKVKEFFNSDALSSLTPKHGDADKSVYLSMLRNANPFYIIEKHLNERKHILEVEKSNLEDHIKSELERIHRAQY